MALTLALRRGVQLSRIFLFPIFLCFAFVVAELFWVRRGSWSVVIDSFVGKENFL